MSLIVDGPGGAGSSKSATSTPFDFLGAVKKAVTSAAKTVADTVADTAKSAPQAAPGKQTAPASTAAARFTRILN